MTLALAPDALAAASGDPTAAARLPPTQLLNSSALACEQGLDGDDTWRCAHVRQSHVVCGHPGTLSFSSPTYVVLESDRYVAVTVRRSGGGLGRVAVRIGLTHVTTDDSDISLRAQYSGATLLVFEEGVVALTLRVTVHDDLLIEPEGEAARSNFTGAPLPPLSAAQAAAAVG